jgi:predicted Zn-dependent peptidase
MLKHQLTTLKNGLRLITVPMKSVESMTVLIGVGAGSRYETEKTNGLSHFLEHMLFKGTKKRPTTLDISSALDSIGAEFNGGTEKEWTIYYVKANAAHQNLAFDILADMVLNSKLEEEEIEREKGVIIEELNMYEDTPNRKISDVFESLLYSPTSLGWEIIGGKENIKNFQKDDFLHYQKKLYSPDNMVVVKAGKVEEKEALALTEKYFGGLKPVSGNKFKPNIYPEEKNPRVKLRKKRTNQSHFCLGFRSYPNFHPDRYALSILAIILGGNMSSRMFTQVRERRGLAYHVRTLGGFYLDTGYLVTQASVDVNKIDEAVKVILNEYWRIIEQRVALKELDKAKEFLKGRLVLNLEYSDAVAERYALQAILEKKIKDPQETMEKINKVTSEDIQRVAKDIFAPEKLNLAIIGPYNNEERFLKLLK